MNNLKQQIQNLKEDQELIINIPNGEIEVYFDGEEYSVSIVSDEYDESYMYDDIEVVVKEVQYYL